MRTVAIRVENLSKQYRIGLRRRRHDTLRDQLAAGVKGLFSRNGKRPAGKDVLWAVKDVSFDVKQGEVVGIIGRNGAGKSTLLKIVAGITEPTAGRVEVYGRVGSLLDVGTGFHPELTGRENIYLNAAILGMRKSEIDLRFDEIVAFAEVEKFIDTPVKHYSSGMYVRLGFAVAAHMEPEILIVDEALAVGDVAFQTKCLNKMRDVGREGRTVLFVSHAMQAITRLCQRCILIENGHIVADGPPDQVGEVYLGSAVRTVSAREWPELKEAGGNDVVRLRAVRVRTEEGQVTDRVDIRQPIGIEMEFDVLEGGHVLAPNYHFFVADGSCAFAVIEQDSAWRRRPRPKGRYMSTAWIPGNFLQSGKIVVGAAVSTLNPPVIHVFERAAVAFEVIDSFQGDGARSDYTGPMPGVISPLLRWTTHFRPDGMEMAVAPSEDADLRR